MSVLDFKEIPPANIADGMQDTFELFARDYLSRIGFKIVSDPNRGPDGGKDFLVQENRLGIYSASIFRWLVSCKHKAHSGSTVTPDDEDNIVDRLAQFNANGFIGFYSTVISSGLANRFDSLRDRYDIQVLDHERIENVLLTENNFSLARRYFPVSSKKWKPKRVEAARVFGDYEPLECEVCGKDLLSLEVEKPFMGVVVFVNSVSTRESSNFTKKKVLGVYSACKGRCDRLLENQWWKKGGITGWADIADLTSPPEYLRWTITIWNEMEQGTIQYAGDSFDKLKLIWLRLGQMVLRDPDEKEMERYRRLREISFS